MSVLGMLHPSRPSLFDKQNRWMTGLALVGISLSLYTNLLWFDQNQYWTLARLMLDGLLIGSVWYLHWERRHPAISGPSMRWLSIMLAVMLAGGFLHQASLAKGISTPSIVPEVSPTSTPSPTPSPFVFQDYHPPKIEVSNDYSVLLVGDSMTKALGPHMNYISQALNAAYPDAGFATDNYAVGSTNVLSLPERLEKRTDIDGTLFDPILDRQVDVLIVESFANNPLSSLPREEGLQKQREMLTQFMTTMIQQKPKTYIIFLATVAPNKENYAKFASNLTSEESKGWAEERMAYLENHIQFARDHKIPLINVYDQTLDENRSGKLEYLSSDFIHPSEAGVRLISQAISDFIITNSILPKEEN